MNKNNGVLRPATPLDIPEITALYRHYVLTSTVSFEETPPTEEEMLSRMHKTTEKNLPFMVVEGENGLLGYAYVLPYRPRSAYRFTVEHSVYVAPHNRQAGTGRKLMESLIWQCRSQGYKQMIAVIGGSDNLASIRFHESLGFRHSGTLQKVGFKFNRWIDSVLMQRELEG